MVKVRTSAFTIKLAKPVKETKQSKSTKNISRRCFAVVEYNNESLVARVCISPIEDPDEYILIPFTDKSLELKGKTYVFIKDLDKYGHIVCITRDSNTANISYGLNSQYDVLKPGLLISGFIIRNNGRLYFDYEQLIAYTEKGQHINEVKIDEDKPLFK